MQTAITSTDTFLDFVPVMEHHSLGEPDFISDTATLILSLSPTAFVIPVVTYTLPADNSSLVNLPLKLKTCDCAALPAVTS